MSNYKRHFFDYTLDVTIPDGFVDMSYRNDTCPSWAVIVSDDERIKLYVDYADCEQREDTDACRFTLVHENDVTGEYVTLAHTDNYNEILTVIEKWENAQ